MRKEITTEDTRPSMYSVKPCRIKLKNRIQIVIFSLIYGLIDLEQLGFRDR
ncbi:MAG: hypothetical protein LBI28_06480 [Treponema sp.]|nr:hypothetical protein [Treponema sp.]